MAIYIGPAVTVALTAWLVYRTAWRNAERVRELRESGELGEEEYPESTESAPTGGFVLAAGQLGMNYSWAHAGDVVVGGLVVVVGGLVWWYGAGES